MTINPPEKLKWKFTLPVSIILIGIILLYWLHPPSWSTLITESYNFRFLYEVAKWFFTIAISIVILVIVIHTIWGPNEVNRED